MNVDIENDINVLEQEMDELDKQYTANPGLNLLDKRNKVKEKYIALCNERDEQLKNSLLAAKMVLCNANKLEDGVQFYLDNIAKAYHEIESEKYSAKYINEKYKEINENIKEIERVYRSDIEKKQDDIKKLYSRYCRVITVKAKDVSTTELMLFKEELSTMSDDEVRKYHANNKSNEVINRLGACELKKRNLNPLPDFSPMAEFTRQYADSANANAFVTLGKHAIPLFSLEADGITLTPKAITITDLKNKIRRLQTGVSHVKYVKLTDLID